MTKWIVAAGMMITAALATATTTTQPAAESTQEIATGTCSYTCSSNGVTYLNRTRCLAACSGVCELEAC